MLKDAEWMGTTHSRSRHQKLLQISGTTVKSSQSLNTAGKPMLWVDYTRQKS